MDQSERRQPNWTPLQKVVPAEQLGDWMWMGRVERGQRVIEQYKHCDTRRYLNLDERGGAWQIRYAENSIVPDVDPLPLDVALRRARS